MKAGEHAGRICGWCDLPLQARYTLAESRRRCDSLHLYAREHSICDPLESLPEKQESLLSAYKNLKDTSLSSICSSDGSATVEDRLVQAAWQDRFGYLGSRLMFMRYDDQRYQRRPPNGNETIRKPHNISIPSTGSADSNKANIDSDYDKKEIDGVTLTDMPIEMSTRQCVLNREKE